MSSATGTAQFGLNAEQQAIRELAVSFGKEEIEPHAIEWDQTKFFPVDVIKKAATVGMGGICVAEEMGGSGLGRIDSVLIYEGLAAACPSIAGYLSVHNMVGWAIDTYGNEEQRKRFLPKLCTMEWLGAYCLSEPASGSDAAALTTSAVLHGDSYVLNGVKQFISGAGAADIYIVMARTGGPGPRGVSAFILHKDTPGLSFGACEKKMGWNAQPTRQVILEDVHVQSADLLGASGSGFNIAMAALDGGRLNIAACSLGGARSALAKALAYTQERQAFGRPISDFQALQFRLADMATHLEVAQTFLWSAASSLDAKAKNAPTLCAMAKRFVTDTCFDIANDALQLLGGYGYLVDYGIEKLVRDLRVHQILEGTNEIMRVIIARTLVPNANKVGRP